MMNMPVSIFTFFVYISVYSMSKNSILVRDNVMIEHHET